MELEMAKQAAFAEEMCHMEEVFQQILYECKAALDQLEANSRQLLKSIQTSEGRLQYAASDTSRGAYTRDELDASDALLAMSRSESGRSEDSYEMTMAHVFSLDADCAAGTNLTV